MRQLGVRLPEFPPVKTDVETPSEIQPHERHHPLEAPEPYPVEVHRIERHAVEPVPVESPRSSAQPIASAPAPLEQAVVEPPAAHPVDAVPVEPLPSDVEPIASAQAPLQQAVVDSPAAVHPVHAVPVEPPPSDVKPIASMPVALEEPIVEPAVTAQDSEVIPEPPAPPQSSQPMVQPSVVAYIRAEPIAEPVSAPVAAREPLAASPAAAQASEPMAPLSAGMPAISDPVADAAAVTQALPDPVAESAAGAQLPPALRPETSSNTLEQPSALPSESQPEYRPGPAPAPSAAIQAPPQPASEPARMRLESLPLRIMEVEAEPKIAEGRWEEFQEFRRFEPGRGSRTNLQPMPPLSLPARGLLAADREPEHRSSFLTIVVPGIAAILAVGALLWSGSLRDRVLRQDAQMTALQEQNRKLADALAQMNVGQKVAGASSLGSTPASSPTEKTNVPAEPTHPQTLVPPAKSNTQAPPANDGVPAPTSNAPAPAREQAAQSAGKREGVSVPPSMSSAQRKGSQRPVGRGYHPEIVPPYPTVSQAQKTAQTASRVPPPTQQFSRAPSSINSSASPAASSIASPRTQGPSAAPTQSAPSDTNPATGYGIGSSMASSATGTGVYASPLAQNIEAVEGLQRQSQVPLREFHARDGVQTKVTPGLFVSVRSADQAHGTYALVVNGGPRSYQLRGYVNGPLAFVDNATHRGYELVILRIAGQEVYGYLRPGR